jgi:opacity protein-like surface antigen
MKERTFVIAMAVMIAMISFPAQAADAVDAAFAAKIKEHEDKETQYKNQAMNDPSAEKKAQEEHRKVESMLDSYGRYIACRDSLAVVAGCFGI